MLVRCYRGKLSVWAALCVLVLGWFYIYPGYKLPQDKEIVEEVLRQGEAWQKNQTGIDLYRLVSRNRFMCLPKVRPGALTCHQLGSHRSLI